MSADRALEAMAARADVRGRHSPGWLKALAQDRRIRAYRKLFLTPSGEMKPEAAEVIADLSALARLGMIARPDASDAELRERNGAQGVVLHMIECMDLSGRKLRALAVRLREEEK